MHTLGLSPTQITSHYKKNCEGVGKGKHNELVKRYAQFLKKDNTTPNACLVLSESDIIINTKFEFCIKKP